VPVGQQPPCSRWRIGGQPVAVSAVSRSFVAPASASEHPADAVAAASDRIVNSAAANGTRAPSAGARNNTCGYR